MEDYNDEINLGDNVVKKLKGIYDPEIPVDIYEQEFMNLLGKFTLLVFHIIIFYIQIMKML